MRPTEEQIVRAVGRLGALAMFPAASDAQEEIMRLLERLVATEDQLEWLVLTMIDRVGKWEGPRQMREVFCSQFQAADGKQLTGEPENLAPMLLDESEYHKPYKSLPPPPNEPIPDEERAEWAKLDAKIKAKVAREKLGLGAKPAPDYKPPEWLQ